MTEDIYEYTFFSTTHVIRTYDKSKECSWCKQIIPPNAYTRHALKTSYHACQSCDERIIRESTYVRESLSKGIEMYKKYKRKKRLEKIYERTTDTQR